MMRCVFQGVVAVIGVLSLAGLSGLGGCGDAGTFENAGFSVAWTIQMPDGTPLTCEIIGAYQTRITVTDVTGARFVYDAPCNDRFFETKEWDVHTGRAEVTASLYEETGGELAVSSPVTVTLQSGKLRNTIPTITFAVPLERFADQGPVVTLSYELSDGAGGLSVCNDVNVGYLRFDLLDSGDEPHRLGTVPCQSFASFDTGPYPLLNVGAGTLTVTFLTVELTEISDVEIPVFLQESETSSEDIALGPILLYTPAFTHPGQATAPFVWYWDKGDAADTHSLTEADCETLGIDQARLWIWHDDSKAWWSDTNWMAGPCPSTRHAVDAEMIADPTFSGIYLEALLNPGDYAMSLGFFREVSVAGGVSAMQLVYLDAAGSPDDPTVAVEPDTLNQHRTRMDDIVDDFEQGNVAVTLGWQSESGEDLFGACDTVDVSEIAFRLTHRAGVAVDVGRDPSLRCRDRLQFSSLPHLEGGFVLYVIGIDPKGKVGWYGRCAGIAPETDEGSAETTCDIARYL